MRLRSLPILLAASCAPSSLVAPAVAQTGPRIVVAEPLEAIAADYPVGVPAVEAQVVLVLVVDTEGRVESAIVTETLPRDLPDAYRRRAIRAVRGARFAPSTRDGRAIRSRVEYVVVFPPPKGGASDEPGAAADAQSAPADSRETSGLPADVAEAAPEPLVVDVRGAWISPRGLGDVTVNREVLEASPRQFSSELLSAAPGFFVDHENSEGLGNDVYLRGFDLEHGSGIEMGVGSIVVNQPIHIQGQGYVDANFIIPEVVDSLHVLQGPYDPRQGDAAIVGSAFFNLGVPDRGYHVATSYGSFGQARVMGIAAPRGAPKETFAAFAVRKTDGFGARRASRSGTVNTQVGFDLGPSDHLRVLGVAYAARTELPGVVREDHVEAGLIDFYGTYPFFSDNQAAQSSRALLGAEWEHVVPESGRIQMSAWMMWNDFLVRQNFAGAFESSQIDPNFAGLGDLFERTNEETALGFRSLFQSHPVSIGESAEAVFEPGAIVRVGNTEQTRSLLVPDTLDAWDRRTDAGVSTLDAGAYFDVDLELFDRLRIAGGPRVDVLAVSVDDRLANRIPAGLAPEHAQPGQRRSTVGVVAGPRATVEYEVDPRLAVSTSYGEGFRSLNPPRLEDGAPRPYSKVRSVEAGLRGQDARGRYKTLLAVYNTWVENELVFVAESGGFETQARSIRRGIVGSLLAKPAPWLLASTALSVTDAFFQTNVPNVAKRVPSVPPLIYRADVMARTRLARLGDQWLGGRIGLGYTLLSPLHLADDVRGPVSHVLNATAGLRYDQLELEIDAFNVLDLEYADEQNSYISNWAFVPGQQPSSFATHLQASPPLTVLATLAVHL